MAETPNHEYNIPERGTQDWHNPLNENFRAFEVDIELRDTGSNLVNYTPTEGAKFLAIDTGIVYTGDDTTWVPQFILPGYDASTDEAKFGRTIVAPELAIGILRGSLTGGMPLTTIAGDNLSIDNNGQLNASTGGGGGGISSLRGGDGIEPTSISDGNTLTVAWGDSTDLNANGSIIDWSGAADLDASGSVADWSGAADLDSAGAVDTISGSVTGGTSLTDLTGNNLSIDSNGRLNASIGGGGISGLSGGEGINPDSIGDGDTLSVAWEDASGLSSNGEITGGNWTINSNNILEPSDSLVDGISVTQAKTPTIRAENDPFNVLVGGALAMELEGESGGNAGNVVMGHSTNTAESVVGATISGGGSDGLENTVKGNYSIVGGGLDNTASGVSATVAGGRGNAAEANFATIAGGGPADTDDANSTNNVVYDDYGTVAGGGNNQAGSDDGDPQDPANAEYATVGGGRKNTASADGATVSGGLDNTASATTTAVGGGGENTASDAHATVSGGLENTANEIAATVGGGANNTAAADFATIAGGGPADVNDPDSTNNVVYDNYGTIAGGGNNQAGSDDGNPQDPTSAEYATVGGGYFNIARAAKATVAGGQQNTVSGDYASITGGFFNDAGARFATVAGGSANTAGGEFATVPGGRNNVANGNYSLAAGREANTNDNDGAFVWGDSSDQQVEAVGSDEFRVQAGGGAVVYSQSDLNTGVLLSPGSGSWSSLSTRTAKTSIDPIDPVETLAKVEQLEVSRWEYDSEEDAEHVGPMAEEFYDTFGLGVDEKHITGVDADGVALAAIQGISEKLDDAHEELAQKDERIEEQADRLDDLEAENETLRDETATLREENEALRERLAAVEEQLANIDRSDTSPAADD